MTRGLERSPPWTDCTTVYADSPDGSVAGSWRLPNRNELLSLLSNGSGLPVDHPFIEPEDPSDYYWSSTTYPFIT